MPSYTWASTFSGGALAKRVCDELGRRAWDLTSGFGFGVSGFGV